jgi:hypothetical protein
MYTIRASFSDAYNKILEDIKLQILKEPDSTIIGTTTEELADYYYSNKHYDPVKIDLERTETLEQKNEVRIIGADQREDSYRDEGDLPKWSLTHRVISFLILLNTGLKSATCSFTLTMM